MLAQRFSRPRFFPDVFADGESDLYSLQRKPERFIPFGEITFLVKHTIIGQEHFASSCHMFSITHQSGRIIEVFALLFGESHNGCQATCSGSDFF